MKRWVSLEMAVSAITTRGIRIPRGDGREAWGTEWLGGPMPTEPSTSNPKFTERMHIMSQWTRRAALR